MYEHLRNEFVAKISLTLPSDVVERICVALDETASHYEITEKTTELAIYEGTMPKLAEMYLQTKRLEGLSPRSIDLYRGRLTIFFEIMQMRPEDISTNDIRCFLVGYQRQNGISDRTLDKFRQIINGFFVWCVNEEYLVKNPCHNIKEIKYEVTPRKSLNRMELELMRRSCMDKRELAIIDTLYSTGCRVTELSNMKRTDIDSQDKSIHIVGKGKKHNTCYFNTNAQLSLNDYINSRDDDSDYLFVCGRRPHTKLSTESIEKIVRNIGKRAGLHVTPHILRHTYATLSLQSGMPLTHVQKTLGHVSSDTTLIYAEIMQDDVKNSHLKYVI